MPKRYHTLLNLLGLSIIIYLGVDIFYTFLRTSLGQHGVKAVVAQSGPDKTVESKPPFEQYQAIIDRNIFGSTDTIIQDVGPEDIEALEPTSLKISLLGTVTGPSRNTYAVIEEIQKRKQGLFRIGDSIENATIRMILRGKVVLRVEDRDEILTMDEAAAQPKETQRGQVASGPSRVPAGSETTITVNRSEIEASLSNINQLLTEVRVRPHYKDGKPDGLAISRIKRDSFFAKLGLRDGDVVRAIDNANIRSPDDILDLYKKLKAGSRVGVQIDRRGQQQTLNYNFR
jgi:general secretion pathway protein C